ncbi:hypothetical protein BH10PSE6_BH10PSE6_26250 [soil metagenome]
MIASYKFGFIFVRTRKTASTAVQLGLSTICGPDDVIAPLGAGQELLRASIGGSARNFSSDKSLEQRLAEAVKTGKRKPVKEVVLASRMGGGFRGHMSLQAVRECVPEEFWKSAYKFTTERHPYEKALSLAHFRYKDRHVPFERHLDDTVRNDADIYRGYNIYFIGGKPAVDGYLLHDTLSDDIARLRERLNLPPFELPQARAKRTDRRPAAELLTDNQKEFIYRACKPEFDLFGWKQ